jgi:predicted RNA methylase
MLTWSHAVGPDGKVTGLELDPYFGNLARDSLVANGIDNSEVIIGDALET